jgi:hypothetical protein
VLSLVDTYDLIQVVPCRSVEIVNVALFFLSIKLNVRGEEEFYSESKKETDKNGLIQGSLSILRCHLLLSCLNVIIILYFK